MKQFNNLSYGKNDGLPAVHTIEACLNTYHSERLKLNDILKEIPDDHFRDFAAACILYWAEAPHFDERNRKAVLASRVIAAQFPALSTKRFDDRTLREAATFTAFAHRAIQQYLFDVILRALLPRGDTFGILPWWNDQKFVYNADYSQFVATR